MVEHRLPHAVSGVEQVARPEVAPGVGRAVLIEVARPPEGEGVEGGGVARAAERGGGRDGLAGAHHQAVAHGVDADGGQPVLGHVPRVEDHLEEVRRVAVPVDVHVEGLLVRLGGLGHDEPELHRVARLHRLAGREVDVEGGVGIGRLGASFQQERRAEGADDHVAHVLELAQQQLRVGAGRHPERLLHQVLQVGAKALEVDAPEVARLGRAPRRLPERARDPSVGIGGAFGEPRVEPHQALHLDLGRVALRPARERAGAVQAVAQPTHVVHRGLGGEAPQERHAIQARPGEVTEVGGDGGVVHDLTHARRARALGGVVDELERRLDRVAEPVDHPVGDHHRVPGHLVERQERPHQQRIGLALVPGEQPVGDAAVAAAALREAGGGVVVARARGVADRVGAGAGGGVEEVRPIEHPVEIGVVLGRVGADGAAVGLVDGLEQQVAFGHPGVVGPVAVEALQRVVEVARPHVQGRRHAGVEVDEVHAVVGEVVVVALVPRAEGGQVERGSVVPVVGAALGEIERHRDGREGAPALHLVEAGARLLLELGGRDEAGVDPQAGARGGVGPGRRVVGEGDLGQGLVSEIEPHRRARAGPGTPEPLRRPIDARHQAGTGQHQRPRPAPLPPRARADDARRYRRHIDTLYQSRAKATH